MIFRPGETCWRVERARRVAFLVDGADYFAALRRSLVAARRSITMVGWDFDTAVPLTPVAEPADGFPSPLLAFLNTLCERRRELEVRVLAWDFSMIYAFEREPAPAIQFGWRGHKRVHFTLDAVHPVGASHHQKIVVVDDAIAYVGGLDLTFARWDTSQHLANDARRVDRDNKVTRPMHDVQVAVDGEAALALGELVRARWEGATGETMPRPPPRVPGDGGDPWPEGLVPNVEDTDVAIARTASSADENDVEVREIEKLTLEAIAAARRTIYIENQYLTSSVVGEALSARLAEPHGPEVVLVLPKDQGGWLEESSMGVLRGRLLSLLRAGDRHGRLRVYFPVVPGLPEGQCLGVHSKVLIVDDDFVKIGSANLSNRSMGLDTECDVALGTSPSESESPKSKAIAGLRSRLLSEHLGVEAASFERRVHETGSLTAAIESLRRGERSLEPLDLGPEPAVNLAVLDGLVCDPERPVGPERLLEAFVPPGLQRAASRSLSSYVAVLAAALLVAGVWRFTPLGDLLTIDRLVELGRELRESPLAPLYVAAAYLASALCFFPITVLIAGTTLVFDPWLGFVYAMLGTLGSASLTYWIGRWIGRPVVERLLSPRLRRFRAELQRRGFAAVLGARLVPVGNFSLVNLLAGALELRFRSYFLANVLGILPGIIGFTLFADRLGQAIVHPKPENLVLLVLCLAAIIGALSLLRRWLRRPRRRITVPFFPRRGLPRVVETKESG